MSQAPQSFDAIVVGARVAGSAAAIMLGRQGRKVLLLDKSEFPSDTLSTHVVVGGGVKVLERMGIVGELERSGGQRLDKVRTRAGEIEFTGTLSAPGDTAGLCLGRVRMDAAMVELARSIGPVAVRERFRITDLIVESGAVCGVRGADDSGVAEFRAPLTVGADGMRSTVARIAGERIGAFARVDVPCARAYYYAYFKGVAPRRLAHMTHFEFGPRDRGYIAAPCEEGRTVVGAAFDAAAMRSFRTDLTANFLGLIAENPDFAAILEGASLASRVFSSGLLLNTCRVPVCDGALLLGDAGIHADPLFGQGHALALISAEIAAGLAREWFGARSGSVVEAATMSSFTARRDAALKPHYDATVGTSRNLRIAPMALMAWRAAAAEQWAADELTRFSNMLTDPTGFPSFRFARLMARRASAG